MAGHDPAAATASPYRPGRALRCRLVSAARHLAASAGLSRCRTSQIWPQLPGRIRASAAASAALTAKVVRSLATMIRRCAGNTGT